MPSRRDFNKSLLVGGAALLAPGGLLAGEGSPVPQAPATQTAIPEYTLLIKGGTVVDPGQQMHDLYAGCGVEGWRSRQNRQGHSRKLGKASSHCYRSQNRHARIY